MTCKVTYVSNELAQHSLHHLLESLRVDHSLSEWVAQTSGLLSGQFEQCFTAATGYPKTLITELDEVAHRNLILFGIPEPPVLDEFYFLSKV